MSVCVCVRVTLNSGVAKFEQMRVNETEAPGFLGNLRLKNGEVE